MVVVRIIVLLNCIVEQESVAELWMGFLEYYAYTFDSKTCVVSVRQKAPLVKFEKMWMSKCFAIEDPFDLGHNLGGGLSRKSNFRTTYSSDNFS